MKIVRLVWLIWIVKLYKFASTAFNNNQEQANKINKSLIGQRLSDITMKRLIVLVLIILFSVPLLTRTTYNPPETSYEFGLYFINELDPNSTAFDFSCKTYISQFENELLAFVFDQYEYV